MVHVTLIPSIRSCCSHLGEFMDRPPAACLVVSRQGFIDRDPGEMRFTIVALAPALDEEG